MNTVGIVSNSWAVQLGGGASIGELAAQALELGYRVVELREGSLGELGKSSGGIDVVAFRDVMGRLPGLRWILAMELAYLCELTEEDWNRFAVYVEAAATQECGWVRVVDLSAAWPRSATAERSTTAEREAALRLSFLARRAAARGVRLAVEHARQEWPNWLGMLRTSRALAGPGVRAPMVCFDPANLHLFASSHMARQAVRDLSADELGFVHAKQTICGKLAPGVQEGDVDWADQLAVLDRAGFCGSLHFELPAGEDVWERLAAARAYLDGLRCQGNGA